MAQQIFYPSGSDINNRILNGDDQLIWIPLAEQGSTAQKAPAYGIVSEQDLIETVTVEWNQVNWLSMPGTPNPGSGIHIQNIQEFTRLDNLTTGGFLTAMKFYYTSNPLQLENLVAVNHSLQDNGGWRLLLDVGDDVNFQIKSPGSPTWNLDVTMAMSASWQGKHITLVSYIDVANNIWHKYLRADGESDVAHQSDLTSITLPTNGTDIGAGLGVGILAVGTPGPNNRFGNSANGSLMRNVIMQRCTTDFSGYLPEFLQQYHDLLPNELPNVLLTYKN